VGLGDVPAALLAEALLLSRGGDGGGFGVVLADLVPAVVVLGGGEVGLAPLGLAPRRLVVVRAAEPQAQHARHAHAQAHATEARRPRHQKAVNGQHVRGGEVRAAAQVQPDPPAAGVIHDGAAVVLPLHQERRRPAAAAEGEMVQVRGRHACRRQRHQRHLVQRRRRHSSHARRRRREERRRICLVERESRGGQVEVVVQVVVLLLLVAEEPGYGHVAGVEEARVGLRHGCEAEVGVGGCWRHGGAVHQQPIAHHGWMKRRRREGKG
jgi:hypothetical protein